MVNSKATGYTLYPARVSYSRSHDLYTRGTVGRQTAERAARQAPRRLRPSDRHRGSQALRYRLQASSTSSRSSSSSSRSSRPPPTACRPPLLHHCTEGLFSKWPWGGTFCDIYNRLLSYQHLRFSTVSDRCCVHTLIFGVSQLSAQICVGYWTFIMFGRSNRWIE